MKTATKILAAALAVVLVAGAVTAAVLLRRKDKPVEVPTELLPDSGAFSAAVTADFHSDLLGGNGVVLFEDRAALEQFIQQYCLRSALAPFDRSAPLQIPKEIDFTAQHVFFVYTKLSGYFSLSQCYLDCDGKFVQVRAWAEITDEARQDAAILMQGYLIGLRKDQAAPESAEDIHFQVHKTMPGQETTASVPALRLELQQKVKPGDASVRVRVIQDGAQKVLGGTYYMLQEYRGYEWRILVPKEGKEPTDIRFDTLSPLEYDLLLDAYPPLEPGRTYRATLRLRLEPNEGDADPETLVNAAVDFTVQ
ncbi:MAG: hypothetical protein LBJ11_10395 [Oscillospiraceae bacterium]|jgi:hypothetical protein|nr:hypothetical protein [Oscillospiraceae bacterium]